MPRQSAAIVAYRFDADQPAFLLVHPGGPFWQARDLGAWSLPKGLVEAGEDPQAAARREFREEVGLALDGPLRALTPQLAYRGKVILPWLARSDLDLSQFRSQTFRLEWPPRSGRFQDAPEVDRAEYFPLSVALRKILPAQAPILQEAADLLAAGATGADPP
ncbi:NUDIX domain-containing protein [soil metagenome]